MMEQRVKCTMGQSPHQLEYLPAKLVAWLRELLKAGDVEPAAAVSLVGRDVVSRTAVNLSRAALRRGAPETDEFLAATIADIFQRVIGEPRHDTWKWVSIKPGQAQPYCSMSRARSRTLRRFVTPAMPDPSFESVAKACSANLRHPVAGISSTRIAKNP